jgi:molecular chaperone GrpE
VRGIITEEDPAVREAASAEQAGGAEGATPEAEAVASDGAVAGGSPDLDARLAELERQLVSERAAATDYMNRWQRAQADFANYKRRAQQDQQQMQRALAVEAARLILPALDSFERAFATLPPSLQQLTWISGVELIRLQLESALNAIGIRLIEAAPGQPFDPAKHEPIGEVESAEHPAGNVAVVVQRGYQIEGYILRPALVQLAKAAESATTSASPLPAGEGPGVRSAESATASTSSSTDSTEAGKAQPESDTPARAGGENPEPNAS